MTLVIKDYDCDSTIWNGVKPRQTDIVIASCYKAGTTLTQQIVNLLINGNSEFNKFKSLHQLSSWVELVADPLFDSPEPKLKHIENLPDPRFLKSHLPFEALPYYPDWKYIYLVRDARDIALSLYNQSGSYDPKHWQTLINGSFFEFWDKWLETGSPLWSFWENVNSWWKVRHLPNVLFVHYSNLDKDKLNEIERIANFLNLKLDAERKEIILHQSSLAYMKENWEKFQPPGFLPQGFFGKGKNGLWKELLTPEMLENYEKVVSEKLPIELVSWMENAGDLPPLAVIEPA
ncbi:sulfotransferase domain-containing protein [Dolichospermum sp. LEGE 00240]|uniref:sulfotransferase domain-containing protein n=1 Tax=Dolichospermum sp. LEGE 00240 TaxID=1828603 RepID=UPI00188126FE|nr:sulfotransferase domain-containing protein [Dolichospermum sp. LEGE 00240]MBE9248420.1 sulfotransferase domain-containing protein [Dolichospermum sp. LEGE 00240]